MPYNGDTKVVVDFNGTEGNGEGIKTETESTSLKMLPPWMIRSGMILTKEQHEELKQEITMDGNSTSSVAEFSDDKRSTVEPDDKKNLQDEYIKAYYAALLKKQLELEEAAKKQEEMSNTHISIDPSSNTSNGQVGMKLKREEDEADDGIEWEEAPIAGNSSENYKVNDLNVQADASANDDDDDVDWEEG